MADLFNVYFEQLYPNLLEENKIKGNQSRFQQKYDQQYLWLQLIEKFRPNHRQNKKLHHQYLKMIKVLMLILLLMSVWGYKYQERPPIKKEQCSDQNKQKIQEEIQFFSQLKILKQFLLESKDHEVFLKNLQDLDNQIQEQKKVIYYDIFVKLRLFKFTEVTVYKQNKDFKDAQAIECYNNLAMLSKDIIRLRDKCLKFYSSDFIQNLCKHYQTKIPALREKMLAYNDYNSKDIEQELQQLNQDYRICFEKDFKNHKLIQQNTKLKHKTQLRSKQSKQILDSKLKNAPKARKNAFPIKDLSHNLLEIGSNWKFAEQYQFILISPRIEFEECNIYKNEIEDDFLEFLKIQEIIIFKLNKENQDEIIDLLTDQRNNYILNNKIILDKLNLLKIKDISVYKFPIIRNFIKSDSQNIQSQYFFYYSYSIDIIELQQIFRQVQDFSKLLDEKFIQEIQRLKKQNNQYINNQFKYQPEEVYKELNQINRDYQTCNGGEENYDQYIKEIDFVYLYVDPYEKSLTSKQKQECKEEMGHLKQDILTIYKKQSLLKFKLDKNYHQFMEEFYSFDYDMHEFNQQKIKFNKITQFQKYSINHKPDDNYAILAFQRLHLINDKLILLEQYQFEVSKFLNYFKGVHNLYKKLIDKKFEINESQLELESQLDKCQKQYKFCTGRSFDDMYQIQKDQQSPHKEQVKYANVLKHMDHIQMTAQDDPSILNIQVNMDWKYYDYDPITKIECNNEFEEIKEDILQFLKIQELLKYKKIYQKDYNSLIQEVLAFKDNYLEDIFFLSNNNYGVKKYDSTKFPQYIQYPKNLYDDGLDLIYNKLIEFSQKIVLFTQYSQKADNLFKLAQDNEFFKELSEDNILLNEYIDKQFTYNEADVEKELLQLLRDYEICTGKKYKSETQETKLTKLAQHFRVLGGQKPQKTKKKQVKHSKRHKQQMKEI